MNVELLIAGLIVFALALGHTAFGLRWVLPALKDGSLGLVVDAKWKSKKWVKDQPEAPHALPLLEAGLVLSHNNAGNVQKALKEYRLTLNDLLEKAAEVSEDNVPKVKIPVAEKAKPRRIQVSAPADQTVIEASPQQTEVAGGGAT